jgi:hypothetical protein
MSVVCGECFEFIHFVADTINPEVRVVVCSGMR